MPRKFIKRYLPKDETLRNHPHLRHFGERIQDPNLWHLNRHSVAGATVVGLFCAFVPMPFQMILAAAVAILLRVNLPISVALVWISNPLTIPFFCYFCFRVGLFALGWNEPTGIEFSMEWVQNEFPNIWKPFLLGCFLSGSIAAVTGYFIVSIGWRISVIRKYRRRRARRAKKIQQSK